MKEDKDRNKLANISMKPSEEYIENNLQTTASLSKAATYMQSKNMDIQIEKITLSALSPFQKRVLIALCQVPRSRYTTYKRLATYLSTSPRAVGNALRHNPFAPSVPCHRVLANDGRLGGFRGSSGKRGKPGLYDKEKKSLLKIEGVKFDGKGLVLGSPWNYFSDMVF